MLKRDAIWLGADASLAALFLWATSTQWIEPELRDVPGASAGGPFVFMSFVAMALGPWLVLRLLGLVAGVRRGLRDGNWFPLCVVCLTVGAWVWLIRFSANLVTG